MLDHIVIAAPELAAARARFTDLTGVSPAPGGSHREFGTANCLVGLGGGAYLEIIGPDPDAPPPRRPRPFGIDALAAMRVVTWAVQVADLDRRVATARARGYDPGTPRAMSRLTPDGRTLRWRLTSPDSGSGGGLVPFLIDWADTPHPTTRDLPVTALVAFEATHPAPDAIQAALTALGADLAVHAGDRAALTLVIEGRHGHVVLT